MLAPAPPWPATTAAAGELPPPPPTAVILAEQVPSGTVPAGSAPAVVLLTLPVLVAGSALARSTPTPMEPSTAGNAMASTATSWRMTRRRWPTRREEGVRPFTGDLVVPPSQLLTNFFIASAEFTSGVRPFADAKR